MSRTENNFATKRQIFLSWSGKKSKAVARAFYSFAPLIVQASEPFMSEEIEKGSRWRDIIGKELRRSEFGIICVTKENIRSPWLLYEAGALSNHLETRVCTFLFDATSSDLRDSPLDQFQATAFTETDCLRLFNTMNNYFGDLGITPSHLEKTFNKWWGDLKKEINLAQAEPTSSIPQDKPASLWMLSHDLLWTMNHSGPSASGRSRVLHGIKQCLHHFRAVNIKREDLEHRLVDLRQEVEGVTDWNEEENKKAVTEISFIKDRIAEYVKKLQPDFESGL